MPKTRVMEERWEGLSAPARRRAGAPQFFPEAIERRMGCFGPGPGALDRVSPILDLFLEHVLPIIDVAPRQQLQVDRFELALGEAHQVLGALDLRARLGEQRPPLRLGPEARVLLLSGARRGGG